MESQFSTLKKLMIGCGSAYQSAPGDVWVFHDRTRHNPAITCVFDLEHVSDQHYLAYDETTGCYVLTTTPTSVRFAEIMAKDVLEHVSPSRITHVMQFFWNILAPEQRLIVIVPEANSENALIDPTHYRGFHLRSFDMFDPTTALGRKSAFYGLKPWALECAERMPHTHTNLRFHLRKVEKPT